MKYLITILFLFKTLFAQKQINKDVFSTFYNVSSSFIDNNTIVIYWNNSVANNYKLEYKLYNTTKWIVLDSNIKTVNNSGLVYSTLNSIKNNSSYEIRIKADFGTSESNYKYYFISNKLITGIKNTYVSETQHTITWDVPKTFFKVGVDTYNIQIRVLDGQEGDIGNWSNNWVFTATPDVGLSYNGITISNLTLNRTYEVRVGFFKNGFRSNWQIYKFVHKS